MAEALRLLPIPCAALALSASAAQAEMLADPAADLATGLPVCSESLRTGENPPVSDGWMPATSMSGTPLGMAAMQARDMQGMMAAMAHSRETFVLASRNVTLTQYYQRGDYVACSVSGDVPAEAQEELAKQLAAGREAANRTGNLVAEMRRQYQFASTTAYREGRFTLIFEQGATDTPNLFSLIVIKD